jgi:uncharacterized protein YciI
MRKLFLLRHMPGRGWIVGKPRSEQPEWRAHADFMNELAARGFVILGGPISDTEAILVIDAANEEEIRRSFKDDPWHRSNVLDFKEIREWTILLEHGREHTT